MEPEHYDRLDGTGDKQEYWEEFQASRTQRITSITIENFKGISKPITVPLRPITLLFRQKLGWARARYCRRCSTPWKSIRTGRADIDTVASGRRCDQFSADFAILCINMIFRVQSAYGFEMPTGCIRAGIVSRAPQALRSRLLHGKRFSL